MKPKIDEKQPLLDQLFRSFVDYLDPDAVQKEVSTEGKRLIKLFEKENGWKEFLTTLGKRTFTEEFSDFHAEFWKWYWNLTSKRIKGEYLRHETLTYLAGWGRGMAKSSSIEWACIAEGAAGLRGYVLYVSATQASANQHVLEIRQRLESDEIARAFPHLAEPMVGRHGQQFGWRQDILITKGGWVVRPVGLDVAVRGLRFDNTRPSMIVFDDIDSHDDSLDVIDGKIQQISREILPAGTKNTIKLIAQNLITENSIVNQIFTGKTDILADHIPSIQKAFLDLRVEPFIDKETGKTRNIIVEGTPNWKYFDMDAAQRFLNDSGLEAFYAEYQHDFSLDQQDKVIPEYSDYPTHVIKWSQFQDKFATIGRVIPEHWQKAVGVDIGFTEGHLSAWTWLTVSAMDSRLPGATFCYRGRTFTRKSIDEQADAVNLELQQMDNFKTRYSEKKSYVGARMSHEALGERMTLNRKYGFNFTAAKFGKEDGVAQWRHILRVDKSQPHPFHEDYKEEDGTYHIGRPNFYYVVDDDQLIRPTDDFGLATHRAQVLNWKRRKVSLTSTGLADSIPMKLDEDSVDATRMLLAESILVSTPQTYDQIIENRVISRLSRDEVAESFGTEKFTEILTARNMALADARRMEDERLEQVTRVVQKVLPNAPRLSNRFAAKRKPKLW